jgi:hypothetical protein
MLEPLYYKLAEAERLLGKSRDTLIRLEKAGLLVMHGKNHGKSVTGASLRALAARIEAGEDIWATLKALESASRAPSAAPPTGKARSTKTKRDDGGTSPRPKTASDSLASEPIASVAPAWLKKIT